ncbi:MAG: phosphoglucosamine mutase [Candidatus Marinimicrobia bacterium]|nr:phosphoglucosamine mutase [Candidatus Neomarinimicrobiota bacterium]|tara:strand:- start:19260 stop:20621 length:1362 start_codon:yes stop_codon:yes gene_type:complete
MELIRSISGIRGIIGVNFNDTIASEYAKSFSSLQPQGPLLLGRDTRKKGLEIITKIKKDLISLGRDVYDCDIAPTPIIQFLAKKLETSGAIMITASHNPEEWNGMKFIDCDGCFISQEKNEDLLYNIDNRIEPIKFNNNAKSRNTTNSISLFIDALLKLNFINLEQIKRKKFKVVVDTVNGANYHLLPYFLKKLGCDVVEIFCNNSGSFDRNPEPLAENLNLLCKKVTKEKADLGLACDPDGDRLSIVDNLGSAIGEENTLVLCADSYYNETNCKTPLITNLSSSMCLDYIASKHNVPILRSAIGEANVIELMKKENAHFGGEGNGGVILKDIHLGRDSLVATIMILNMLAKNNISLDKVMSKIPKYYMIKEKTGASNFDISKFYNHLSKTHPGSKKDSTDGLKLSWNDKWLHIRTSNTEPVIRIIAESSKLKTTQLLISDTINRIKNYSIEN